MFRKNTIYWPKAKSVNLSNINHNLGIKCIYCKYIFLEFRHANCRAFIAALISPPVDSLNPSEIQIDLETKLKDTIKINEKNLFWNLSWISNCWWFINE